jgi:hypothetical protein
MNAKTANAPMSGALIPHGAVFPVPYQETLILLPENQNAPVVESGSNLKI